MVALMANDFEATYLTDMVRLPMFRPDCGGLTRGRAAKTLTISVA
jgi:hypothetical protein